MTFVHATQSCPPRPSRPNSLPDLERVHKEWRYQMVNDKLETGKLQIDLLDARCDVPVKRPRMRLRMGPQCYFSSRSKDSNGNWNEGFIFTVSFHNQLFDTIELDLYDKRKGWRSKTRHIGKAKLKLSTLEKRESVFVTFLPLYEYHKRRFLPPHIQLPHNFLKSHIPKFANRDTADQFTQDGIHQKHSIIPLIGSVQVRVRYEYQRQSESQLLDSLTPIYASSNNDTYSICSSRLDRASLGSPRSCRSLDNDADTVHTATIECDTQSSDSSTENNEDECASPENDIEDTGTSEFHDAVEPDLVYVENLDQYRDHLNPSHENSKKSSAIRRQSSVNLLFATQLHAKLARRTMSTRISHTHSQVPATDTFGFYRQDAENKQLQKKGSSSSIQSDNFGDKSFASGWINESFEEVALSHPSFDRMIGLVVSHQTRVLLRAVVRMAAGFGQGFRINRMQLLTCLGVLQTFYSEEPPAPFTEKVADLPFLDKANHFLRHAIIAYGWRGLSYLGDYAKYLKDVMKTKSNKEAIVRYLKVPPEDLLGYEFGLRKGAVFQPSYFVSIDRGYEAIVLGIRGTWSLYDCITDLVCDYRPWKGGLVHSGVLASAQWLFTKIVTQIFHFIHEEASSLERPISSFVLSGHSLGAGVAAVLTMMVVDRLEELRQLSGNPDFQVHCYCYAPTAAVSLDLSERYKAHIHSFVCQDDLVGRLSYGSASCVKELILDSLVAVEGLGGSDKVYTDPSSKQACFDIIETRRQEIYNSSQPKHPLLYIPGQVYQFRRRERQPADKAKTTARPRSSFSFSSSISATSRESSLGTPGPRPERDIRIEPEEPEFTLHYSSPKISEEVLITKTCLEDHMVITYLNAFHVALQDCMRQLQRERSAPADLPEPTASSDATEID